MIYFFSLLLPTLGVSSPDTNWINHHQGNCFTQHLREAIVVNRKRGEIYSKLTHGKTDLISKELIFLDHTGILVAPYFESRSKKVLSQNGLPLLCEVIPPFLPVLKNKLSLQTPLTMDHYQSFSVQKISDSIYSGHNSQGLKGAQIVIKEIISLLALEPRFNCLTRQFITSMDLLIDTATKSPSSDADSLAWDSIRASLLQLRLLVKIDRAAAPFQAQGIPIVCAEIPSLPH